MHHLCHWLQPVVDDEENERRIHSALMVKSLGQGRPDSCQGNGAVGAFFFVCAQKVGAGETCPKKSPGAGETCQKNSQRRDERCWVVK